MSNKKLWGGRFSTSTDSVVEAFTASVNLDKRLAHQDILGSIAHAKMLADVGVLTSDEALAITDGLRDIAIEIDAETFQWSQALEDVHMNIESRLTEKIGEVGKKLHTARSRNDQVATDVRLYVRDALDEIDIQLRQLGIVLLGLADGHADDIIPGFTHMQVAQPVTLGHHLLAWFEMLDRDKQRFIDCRERVNVCPLGSAALAGTSFPIDRQHTAAALGFDSVSRNSLDSVSDRDFIMEFISNSTITMLHLSRICEELVLWSSDQFGFVDLGDAYCTGSSIMPQKKNPDVAELVRGKCARVHGHLNTIMMLMKAQPLAYNRDNQEDKAPLFDTIDTLLDCLVVMSQMLSQTKFNRGRMRTAATKGYSTATDLADYLVRKGVAFRDAHEVVGKAVQWAVENDLELSELKIKTLKGFSALIDDDVYSVLTLEGSVNARDHVGGTAPARVRQAIAEARQRIQH